MTRKLMLASAVLVTALTGGGSTASAQSGGDAIRGRHVFRKCSVCHVVNPSSTALLAPPLSDVIGRPAATIPGFEYSEIMKLAGQRGLVWTKDALYHFLDRPEQFIPGTYMAFAGLEPSERADVIAYLETLARADGKQGAATGDINESAAKDPLPKAPPAQAADVKQSPSKAKDVPAARAGSGGTSGAGAGSPRQRSNASSGSAGSNTPP